MKALITASLLITALLVSIAACAPQNLSIFVEGANALQEDCSPNGELQLLAGSLDIGPAIAADELPRYFAHFGLRSDLQPITTVSGDDTIAGSFRNEFVASSVQLSYAAASGAGIGQNVREPIYFVIPPGTGDESFVRFNMLNAASARALAGAVAPGGSDQVLVTFQFEGNIRAAASNTLVPLRTAPVTFPINVVRSRCTDGGVPTLLEGTCGNAQDNYLVGCQ